LTGSAYDRGYFVPPTIFDHVAADSTIAQEEIFGPILSVIRVHNFDEASTLPIPSAMDSPVPFIRMTPRKSLSSSTASKPASRM